MKQHNKPKTSLRMAGFIKSGYFRDIVNQAGLVIIAQLIPVILSPILSRIYDEKAIAEITGLMAFSSLLIVFSTLKLENAIVVEKEDRKARQLVVLSAMVALFFTIFTMLLVLVLKPYIINSFEIQNVVYYVPLYILFFALLNILNFWFVRIKKFKVKAYSKIIENVSYVGFAIALYYMVGNNEYGLAAGKIIGVGIALSILLIISKIKLKRYSWASHKKLLKDYREYPLHYAPSSFVNVIGLQILVIFIGTFFTKEELGYFGLANMVILLPIAFITQSVGSIFFQKTSEHINEGNGKQAKKVFYQTLGMLTIIAIPAFLFLYFGSTYLFPVIFGSNWVVTGIIAKLLAVVFLSQIIVGPISIVLISLGKIKLNAIWQYGRFIVMTLYMLSLVYIFKMDFLEFIEWYAYGAATIYLFYFLIINGEIRKLGK